jgi:hypothetical protein
MHAKRRNMRRGEGTCRLSCSTRAVVYLQAILVVSRHSLRFEAERGMGHEEVQKDQTRCHDEVLSQCDTMRREAYMVQGKRCGKWQELELL